MSGTTVSRVFGDRLDESISDEARERVLRAARELGYTPNSAAKALRSGRTGLIGLWMVLQFSVYRAWVLDEVRRQLSDSDYALAVTDVDQDYAVHHSFDRALRVPVEGILAFDASTGAKEFAEAVDRLAPNLPFVSMGAFWSESKSYVGVDLYRGAIAAVHHLVQMGRRKIVYLAPEGYFQNYGDRHDGYHEAMLEAGLTPVAIGIEDEPANRIETIRSLMEERRREGGLPDAVIGFYDDIAIDTMVAIQRMGLEPGVDIALVGFNGQPGTDRTYCPLTTVRQPVEEMTRRALELLHEKIQNPSAPNRHVILEPELVVRESTTRHRR